MTAERIDGKAFAEGLRGRVAEGVAAFTAAAGRKPGLAVVLVGEDPASQVYVRNKHRAAVEAGLESFEIRLPADTGQDTLMAEVARLNADPAVDGILVQLPLPGQIDSEPVILAIDPDKDVDGFHPVNVGRLGLGSAGFVPCTPRGCMMLLRDRLKRLDGLHAVVVGRSNIVGKPMAQLLLAANCTVTIAHSRTRNLDILCRTADILVAAVGRPAMIRGDWIKPGATVIDVGVNRVPHPDDPAKTRLVGDVDYDGVVLRAGAVTPVPGGVGPMTIAVLLANTLDAARCREGLPAAEIA
ncbi:MAG: bifunctional methylenetetrahydrofolate dehydrogenase/methenyltetrahydrofolate cyclohydrolase FolD [Sneathiellaceae bacterium]